ncbi:MAG: hypothetical protein PHC66_03700 [Candidatus Nanoarchaeia archaeon]|nr:hypothetical protein [Candidatus Nanoarchaeia archaeon]
MRKDTQEYSMNVQTLVDNRERIIRGLYPGINGDVIPIDITLMEDSGNPASDHLLVRSKVGDQETPFNARRYRTRPKLYAGALEPFEKDYRAYDFLKSAGIGNIPQCLKLEDLPGWLFLTHIEGLPLSKVIAGLTSSKAVLDSFNRACDVYSEFQHKATMQADKLSDDERKILFHSRSLEDQSKNYLISLSGQRGLSKIPLDLYIGLLARDLEGVCVDHGDLSFNNILQENGTGKLFVIDPELKRRNEFAGLGSLLAYSGNYENLWDGLAERYKLRKIKLKVEQENGQVNVGLIRSLFNAQPFSLTNEGKKTAQREIRSNIIHYSIRKIAKRIADGEEDYKLQQKNIERVLLSFERQPEKFDLDEKQTKMARELLGFFEEEQPTDIDLQAVQEDS